eukprot:2958549-Rhodomonas_salina.3
MALAQSVPEPQESLLASALPHFQGKPFPAPRQGHLISCCQEDPRGPQIGKIGVTVGASASGGARRPSSVAVP